MSQAAPAERRRTFPSTVWVITGLWCFLLLGYSVLFPVYQAPDEFQHVDLILTMEDRVSYPNYDELLLSAAVRRSAAMALVGRGNWNPSSTDGSAPPAGTLTTGAWNLTRAEAPPRAARPTFSQLSVDETPTAAQIANRPAWYRNYLTEHPPLYYELMGRMVASTPGASDWSFDRLVAYLRIVSALLLVPIPVIAFATARRIGCSNGAAIVASILPLAVPQLAHIGASVNNDTLLILLAAGLTLLVARILTGDLSGRTSILAGVVGGLALLTKGFALFLPVWVAVAYAAAAWWEARRRATAAVRAVVALGLMLVVGGWWWIRNVVEFGAVQPYIHFVRPAPPGFTPDPGWYGRRFGAFIVERTWGWFAWLQPPTRIPLWLIWLATVVLVGTIVAAFVRPGGLGSRLRLLILLLPAAMILVYVAAQGYHAYRTTGVTSGIQGRYLFAGLVGVSVIAAHGITVLFGRYARVAPVVALSAAIVMHAAAFTTATGAYWGRAGASFIDRVDALAAWAPWPTSVLVLGAVGLLGFTGWAMVAAAREDRAPA